MTSSVKNSGVSPSTVQKEWDTKVSNSIDKRIQELTKDKFDKLKDLGEEKKAVKRKNNTFKKIAGVIGIIALVAVIIGSIVSVILTAGAAAPAATAATIMAAKIVPAVTVLVGAIAKLCLPITTFSDSLVNSKVKKLKKKQEGTLNKLADVRNLIKKRADKMTEDTKTSIKKQAERFNKILLNLSDKYVANKKYKLFDLDKLQA